MMNHSMKAKYMDTDSINFYISDSNLYDVISKLIEEINKFELSYEQKEKALILVNEILFKDLMTNRK
ncbi:MAG: hypothetical protein LBT37_06305 [Lactobacillaceae bacterium]|nr:hypothetical protein [Lactobacillaceae bacterium]